MQFASDQTYSLRHEIVDKLDRMDLDWNLSIWLEMEQKLGD